MEATWLASRPTVCPEASTIHHFFSTSDSLAEIVILSGVMTVPCFCLVVTRFSQREWQRYKRGGIWATIEMGRRNRLQGRSPPYLRNLSGRSITKLWETRSAVM